MIGGGPLALLHLDALPAFLSLDFDHRAGSQSRERARGGLWGPYLDDSRRSLDEER